MVKFLGDSSHPVNLLTPLCAFIDLNYFAQKCVICGTKFGLSQSRFFFPAVKTPFILHSSLTHIFLCSLLSGNWTLNKFLFKIKRKSSPLCSCLSGEEEDISHVIFVRTKYNASREVLFACATKLDLLWRIPLKPFPEHPLPCHSLNASNFSPNLSLSLLLQILWLPSFNFFRLIISLIS
jgi:hypothetical protein